jgi:pimeloyl-ACP methyl ester carboxylesterase
MPQLSRPDGTELYWEQQGDGPPVLIAMHWAGHPRMFEPLAEELARDHRVLTYHPRGTGESTRRGPYSMETDCADVVALLEHAEAKGAVAVAIADAANRAIHVATERPELITTVVIASALPLSGSQSTADTLAGSPSVQGAVLSLIETSYRAGLRTLMEGTNPDLSEADVHRRVDEVAEFCEPEAAAGRLRAWIGDFADDAARGLAGRLWWLTTDVNPNPWFPGNLDELLPELLPEAHVESVPDGPVNRPDATAQIVRRVTFGP